MKLDCKSYWHPKIYKPEPRLINLNWLVQNSNSYTVQPMILIFKSGIYLINLSNVTLLKIHKHFHPKCSDDFHVIKLLLSATLKKYSLLSDLNTSPNIKISKKDNSNVRNKIVGRQCEAFLSDFDIWS